MLKTRTWGLSSYCVNGQVYGTQLPIEGSFTGQEAVDDYRKNRENGEEKDNPNDIFPSDGKYYWDNPDRRFTRIRYEEGLGDRAWMQEKDRNYLRRIAQEEKQKSEENKAIIDKKPVQSQQGSPHP